MISAGSSPAPILDGDSGQPGQVAILPPKASRKRGASAVDVRIYKAVFAAVMSRRLPPGTRLAEAELSYLYQVSRTTVRKALQRLAHDYIVELRPNRGAVVASPTPAEAREIFEARRLIERAVIPLVIKNATLESLQRLHKSISIEHNAVVSGDRAEWIRLGGEFHILLAELAGNSVLLRFASELVSRCSLIIALYESPGAPMCEDDDHQRLVQHIELNQPEAAITLMESHLREIEERLQLDATDKSINLADVLSGY